MQTDPSSQKLEPVLETYKYPQVSRPSRPRMKILDKHQVISSSVALIRRKPTVIDVRRMRCEGIFQSQCAIPKTWMSSTSSLLRSAIARLTAAKRMLRISRPLMTWCFCFKAGRPMAEPKTPKTPDYYANFGLQQDATLGQIKSAHHSLAKKWNPDKQGLGHCVDAYELHMVSIRIPDWC